jgi:hypothetical protein
MVKEGKLGRRCKKHLRSPSYIFFHKGGCIQKEEFRSFCEERDYNPMLILEDLLETIGLQFTIITHDDGSVDGYVKDLDGKILWCDEEE